MSTNKTPFLNLHSWVGQDGVVREEFNENFQKLEDETKRQDQVDQGLAERLTTAENKLSDTNNGLPALEKRLGLTEQELEKLKVTRNEESWVTTVETDTFT